MLLSLLLACADAPAPQAEPVVDCSAAPQVTWEGWGEGFFRTWCGACHTATAQQRNGAPEGVGFETRAQVAERRDRIRERVLVNQDMPVGGGLSPDDLALLDVLLTCDF